MRRFLGVSILLLGLAVLGNVAVAQGSDYRLQLLIAQQAVKNACTKLDLAEAELQAAHAKLNSAGTIVESVSQANYADWVDGAVDLERAELLSDEQS